MDLNPTLLGVAVDVSGSMTSSIRNDRAVDISRLEGVGRGIDALIEDSQRLAEKYAPQVELPLRVFLYAFGLKIPPGYGDLLTLLGVTQDPAFDRFLEGSKRKARDAAERRGAEMRHQATGLGGLAGLARSYGFGGYVDAAMAAAEADARRRLSDEAERNVMRDVQEYFRNAGDTTVNVRELGAMWARREGTLRNAGSFIYGDTPMCACLREIVARFGRETPDATTTHEHRMLLLLSDGQPTDGDPRDFATILQKMGVHVACAFITDQDVRAPRELTAMPDANWPAGARTLFDIASPVDVLSEVVSDGSKPGDSWRDSLSESGWSVPDGARLFAQVNHSETLADFIRIAATAMPARRVLRYLREKR